MYFPVIVHKENATDYGVIAPDFPGVFSGGETLEEALENIHDALGTWFCDDSVCKLPAPSPLAEVLQSEDAEGGAVALVDVDPRAFGRRQENLVTAVLPKALLERIDSLAQRAGKSRAEYLAHVLERAGG